MVHKWLDRADIRYHKLEESFFSSNDFAKYRLREFAGFGERELFSEIVIEGMSVEEINLFRFKTPRKCKHCMRVFGYEQDFEGWELLEKLILKIRSKEAGEFIQKLRINERLLLRCGKCPNCSTVIDAKLCLEFDLMPDDDCDFGLYKYKCGNCNTVCLGIHDPVVSQYVLEKK